MSNFAVGAHVFFQHPEESWVKGTVAEVQPGLKGSKSYRCTARTGSSQPNFSSGPTAEAVVSGENIHAVVGEEEEESVDDLLMLSYLHDSTLLAQVRKRYFESVIYTRIGPIVLALNPFDYNLPNYVDSNMPKYMAEGDHVVASRSKLLPHAWSTAHLSYWLMRSFSQNQSIIVSGESGAGKTETAKIVVKYLGCVSTQMCSESDRDGAQAVTQRVNSTSPILEAFGNAKTVRNDNSSRFGKFMKVQFAGSGVMVGSLIEVYLLEKSRIVTHGPKERGYHSFYQLLRGATSDRRDALGLEDATAYKSLAIGNATVIPGVDDAEDYQVVSDAMKIVGMSPQDQEGVWDTVAGVLSCLRVDFVEDGEGSTIAPNTLEFVKRAARIWQVDDAVLQKELVSTVSTVAGESFTKQLRVSQATDGKDALCKALYERLFLCLVEKINALINNEEAASQWVGLLDIFGFESFEKNSFEQVCINLANETLQNHYNNIIFTRDMEECRDEGIDTASVVFYDNQPCLDLICGTKVSVLSLLDEECQLGKGTDLGFCDKVCTTFKDHANMVVSRTDKGVFTIRHYAGDVKYDVTSFREKNMDALKDSLKLLLRGSPDPLIASLLPLPEERRGGKLVTVGGIFRQQLNKLMATINSTHPHWIRCVKPHHAKKPKMFHGMEVMNQLRYAGVLETVRIRKMSYSMRFPFDDFWKMFKNILGRQLGDGGTTRSASQRILEKVGLGPEVAQVGKTKVFLKFDGYHEVTEALHHANAHYAEGLLRAARAKISMRLANALRVNLKVKHIAAALVGRSSDVLVKERALKAKEKYLLKSFKSLLMLQSQEDTARQRIEADSEDSTRVIMSLRRIDFDRVRSEWVAHLQQVHGQQRDAAVDAEIAGRKATVADEGSERSLLVRLRGFSGEEADARVAVVTEESASRGKIAAEVAADGERVAAVLRERAHKAFLRRVSELEASETAARDVVCRSEATAFHYDAGLVAVMLDALCIGVPKIWAQEAKQRAVIYAAEGESMEWNERKWWTNKAAQDKRDTQGLLALEYRQRSVVMRDEEQSVIAILTAQDRAFEEAAALEWQRMRDEETQQRVDRKRQQVQWQREEEQRRAEQQRLAQLVWAKARAEAERQKGVEELEQVRRAAQLKERAVEAIRLERERAHDAHMPLSARRHRSASGAAGHRPNLGFGVDGVMPQSPRRYLHYANRNPSAPSPPSASSAAAAAAAMWSPSAGSPPNVSAVRAASSSVASPRGGLSPSEMTAARRRAAAASRGTGAAGANPAPTSGTTSAAALARLRQLAKPSSSRSINRSHDPYSNTWAPPSRTGAYLPDGRVVELPLSQRGRHHHGAAHVDDDDVHVDALAEL